MLFFDCHKNQPNVVEHMPVTMDPSESVVEPNLGRICLEAMNFWANLLHSSTILICEHLGEMLLKTTWRVGWEKVVDVSWVCSMQMYVVVLFFSWGQGGSFFRLGKEMEVNPAIPENQGCPSRNCTLFPEENV